MTLDRGSRGVGSVSPKAWGYRSDAKTVKEGGRFMEGHASSCYESCFGVHFSRRSFLGGVAAGLAALAAPQLASAGEVGGYPPPPPLKSPIEGAIDFHVHSAPDVFGHAVTDIEVAQAAVAAKMRAIVLKNHVTMTSDRAVLASKAVPGLQIFGGVVLNRAVGGINPDAVEWMFRMEGKLGKTVWMPTFDADHHRKVRNQPGEGIKAAKNGTLLPETEAVLQVIARENLVLHTGHLSAGEVLAVIKRGRELGVNHMAVTHAMAEAPGLSIAHMKEAATAGAYLELIYLSALIGPQAHMAWMRESKGISIKEMAEAVKAVGAEHFILSTDLGQTGNPIHPDGYKLLVAGLKGEGIGQEEIDIMMKRNPAKLLGLEA
jgi:hypothetical protein